MNNNNYNGSTEYKKVMRFLEIGCNCGVQKIFRERSLLNYAKYFKLSVDLSKIYF